MESIDMVKHIQIKVEELDVSSIACNTKKMSGLNLRRIKFSGSSWREHTTYTDLIVTTYCTP